MAAGYISSTSGIGVADPYDAGLYEAQQDALKRIDEQEKLEMQRQAQRAAQAKAIAGDLDYQKGFLPEDAQVINDKFKQAAAAKSKYYTLFSNQPQSQATQKALEEFKAKEADYKSAWDESNQWNKVIIDFTTKNEDDDDIEEKARLVATARTLPLDKRRQLWKDFNRPVKKPTLDEAVGQTMDAEKEQFKLRAVGQPSVEKVGGRELEVTEKINITPEQAARRSRDMVAENTKNVRNSALKLMKNDIEAGIYPTKQIEAQKAGFNPNDENEMAAYYVSQKFMNRQMNEKSYDELKLNDKEKQALKFEYDIRKMTFKEQQEAEEGLGFYTRMVNAKQQNPAYLKSVRFVDPVTKQESFFVGQTVDAPIGKFNRRNIKDGKITFVTKDGKPVEFSNKIEFVTVDESGNMKYVTTQSLDEYNQGIIKTPFLATTPEQITDIYLGGKGVNADKLIAAKNKGLEKFKLPDGRVDYNKIYKPTEQDLGKVKAVREKPFRESPKDFGGTKPNQLPKQPAQVAPTQRTAPTDVDNAGKPIDAKGAMRQKVEQPKSGKVGKSNGESFIDWKKRTGKTSYMEWDKS